jgi:peptide/nickel transport system substrate-binding protein
MLASNGGWNVEGLKSTVVDTALSNFEKTTNLSQQKKQIYQLEKYAAEQLPTIPLVNNAIWYEYSTAEYTGWPTKDNPYVDPSIVNNFTPAIIVSKLRPVSDQ